MAPFTARGGRGAPGGGRGGGGAPRGGRGGFGGGFSGRGSANGVRGRGMLVVPIMSFATELFLEANS